METENIENTVLSKLNLKFYSGIDLYSDGVIEDVMLNYVLNNENTQYEEFVKEQCSWPVLYHFSKLRANIISSSDIKNTDKVLEIGAGCGAITGKLCEMAKSVTCVELSKKRSMINAGRNLNKQNLEIFVGNFETIEPNLPCDYDVITLIGVFEYAESYISSNRPYDDFLNIVMKHLKTNGRLYIAIENRLGLKYFAGCREDHLGLNFEGIEGYSKTSGVKTFSRNELENLMFNNGCKDFAFYYPYPDYKFPIAIYSDNYLPKVGDLRMNWMNFDQERITLFDEQKVFDSFNDTEYFTTFSNSYLLEITKSDVSV